MDAHPVSSPMNQFKKVTIIIPAYNEESTISLILEKVKQAPLPANLDREIIVVDDGSKDKTRERVVAIPGIQIYFHQKSMGKGAAIKTGLQRASGDIILIQDADLEYDPQDYPVILQPIITGLADLVVGSRFLCQRPKFFTKNGDPFFSHFVGNLIIIALTNLLYGQKITDYEGGYKVFLASLAHAIPVRANGFEFENELICKAIRRRVSIVEVPIRYKPRLYSQGKKIRWWDGFIILWTIGKWRFMPLS